MPLAGIGPATSPLPRECSTTEPQGRNLYTCLTERLERETGIEPASLAWKAKVLPLNYSRIARFAHERESRARKTCSQCSLSAGVAGSLVEEAGFEPA